MRWSKQQGLKLGAINIAPQLSCSAAAKELYTLAMRYPASTAPLERSGPFQWTTPALRAGGEAAVARALGSWVDTTASAADSSMFSSTGAWTSPYSVRSFATFAVLDGFIMAKNLKSLSVFPFFCAGLVIGVSGVLATVLALLSGRQQLARWCFGLSASATALCYAVESSLELCKCVAPYNEVHAQGGDPNYSYPWQWSLNVLSLSLFFAIAAGLTTHPWRTFEIIFVAMPTALVLGASPVAATNYANNTSTVLINATCASCLFATGVHLWAGRKSALGRARRLAAEDAARYVVLWEQELLPSPGFQEALRKLWSAWCEVQAGAAVLTKLQMAPTLHDLLCQGDRLNDVFQAKLHGIAVACGGDFHASTVKQEARAMQKVFRSYRGDWRKLCDLVRCSLVFESIAALETCLHAIGADAELEVLSSSDYKMRLQEGFDAAALSGGYRDIQLAVRLDSAETRSRGVHEHIAEVQLHLAAVAALKSDGGHANYVLRRNLGGQ